MIILLDTSKLTKTVKFRTADGARANCEGGPGNRGERTETHYNKLLKIEWCTLAIHSVHLLCLVLHTRLMCGQQSGPNVTHEEEARLDHQTDRRKYLHI